MNYPESQLILDEIKKAKKILLNCHRGPDSDTVGSALAMREVLQQMDKEVKVICPSEIPEDLRFLGGSSDIKKIDFKTFDFSTFDLFIVMDSSTYGMVANSKEIDKPNLRMVVIDHHHTNEGFGNINLIDSKITSTSELLCKIFSDWDVALNKQIATCLLTGIIGDTGAFQYGGVGKSTLLIAGELIDSGADKDEIIYNIYRSINFKTIKFWGKVIEMMKTDEEYGFVWSAVPLSLYEEYGKDSSAKEDGANLFFPIVKNTDFGVIMVETDKDNLSVSFRSRKDFDVSKIAKEVGGGGHKPAAGAKVEAQFDDAVEKVLTACRKYANKKN